MSTLYSHTIAKTLVPLFDYVVSHALHSPVIHYCSDLLKLYFPLLGAVECVGSVSLYRSSLSLLYKLHLAEGAAVSHDAGGLLLILTLGSQYSCLS